MRQTAAHSGPQVTARVLSYSLVFAFVAHARAADIAPRLVVVESRAAQAMERTFIARLREELRLLGVDVQVRRARSADLNEELWKQAQAENATCSARGDARCTAVSAALSQQGNTLNLLFVSLPRAQRSVYALGGTETRDPAAWAVQASELLRPALLGGDALAVSSSDVASNTPASIVPEPRVGTQSAPTRTPIEDQIELPPDLGSHPPPPSASIHSARISGELGVGLLYSVGMTPPQPVLSLLVGLKASRLLNVELAARVPVYTVAYTADAVTTHARISLLGLNLRIAVLRRPRWDLAVALGAALAIVAFMRSDEGTSWTRTLKPTPFIGLSNGTLLTRTLSLRTDVSLGSSIDPVRLGTSNAPAYGWGRLWISAALGLAAAFH